MFRILPFIQKTTLNHARSRNFTTCIRLFKENRDRESTDDFDKPIKYSSSQASKYRAKISRTGEYKSRLWYEPHVILVSISVFLVYFLWLREENDIDYELGRSLYNRIDGLEELTLKQSLEYNKKMGKDTSSIIQRLQEVEDEKQRQKEEANEID